MNKEILRLAIPNIISNVSVPLLSSVDTALMGHLSELHIGAVGLGTMIFNIIYWNFVFLRMGTTGITAQAYGRQDPKDIVLTLARALLIVAVVAGLILLFRSRIGQFGFWVMNVSEEQHELVARYFYIRIWAVPATLGLYAFFGWYFGMQNALYPLYLTVSLNLLNIGLNFFFVLKLGMEVEGVAWATVIAQYFGLLLALLFFLHKYRSYLEHLKMKAVIELEALGRFLLINRDIFIRTLCLTFVYGFFYSQASAYGETVLAANVILLQFVFWMSYGIDGFAFAAESLVGKYVGIGDPAKLLRSIRMSQIWGLGIALVYGLVYFVARDPLLLVFTRESGLLDITRDYFIWIILFPILSFLSFMWDGIFVGLTASRSMRNSMGLALLAFLLAFFLLGKSLGNHGLWLALSVFLLSRGLVQVGMFRIWGTKLR
jgi:MATE family multidrug resistance protein